MPEFAPIHVALPGPPPLHMSVFDTGTPADDRCTLLAIHGVGGKKEQWREQLAYFAPHYRVLAPDLRGHHESSVTDGPYTMDRITDDLCQLLDGRQVRAPIAVLGHSYGGVFALHLALARPELVAQIVLIGVAQRFNYGRLFTFATRAPVPGPLLEWARIMWFRRKFNATAPIMRAMMAQALLPWRGWERLHTIQQPVLAIAGKLDVVAPPRAVARLVAQLPHAELRVVRHVKHKIHLQRPHKTNEIIAEFLRRYDSTQTVHNG